MQRTPGLFWAPLQRIAVLGQLNKIEEVIPEILELKRMKRFFEEKATYLTSRFIKEEVLVEHLLEGMRKAA